MKTAISIRNLFLVIALYTASVGALIGQEPLLLADALDIGLRNNYQLQILRANELIAKNRNNAANADFLPTVGLDGAYSFTSTNTQQEFFNGESRSATAAGSRNANASLQANWTVFDGFRRQALREILILEEQRTQAFTRAEVLRLIEQIELAYYQLAEMQRSIELTQLSIALNKAIMELAEQKQRIGAGSQAEVLQASSQLNADSILLIQQIGNQWRQRIVLNQIIQQPIESEYSVSDTVILEALPDQADMQNLARNNNPALILSQLDQQATEYQIQEIKSVLYPRLGVSAAYNYNFSRAEVGFLLSNRTFGPTARATVTYDIFSGRNLKKELQNVDLLRNNLVNDEKRLAWDLAAQISDAYANYQNLQELRSAEEKNILIAEQNTLLANELYRQGRNTSFEVREAVQQEIEARNRLLQNTFDLKYLEIQLKALTGILEE